ncbi:V-set and transmembrane domain-containing 2 [Solea senegalensis]|uniref:V-set and transmembrane domain-containing protein 2-like protein n=1 Tax=Solea senegalensis TaxID=28829 RepID=A0AAV6SRG4_SOLSE|nr:V-set and transmembrane domain-containing protein 2-like protein [Solea senegalensis]KAG7519518.1 V-set and transmembrane domain-containing 2 [Solea senegalensis]
MGAFRLLLRSLHYMGLYIQLSVSTRQAGHGEVENHISGNAMFTEVPHDMTAHRGQDVEMACSFRGAGMPSYSLEIQWWYIRNHLDWTDRQPWTTNEVAPEEEMPKDATKISVVKVVGSNISHKLRLSRVKPSDEGTYECRVIDFSDHSGVRHHRVRAYLQVVQESDITDNNHNDNFEVVDDTKRGVGFVDSDDVDSRGGGSGHAHSHHQGHGHHQERGKQPSSSPAHRGHSSSSSSQQQKAGRELRKRDVDSNHSHNDCTNEPSCAL